MKWLPRIVAAFLLVLWAPVTVHCMLEAVPGFSFLQCCCGDEEAPEAPGDCRDEVCGTVESGLYKIEDNPTVAPGLALLFAMVAGEWLVAPPTDAPPVLLPASSAPPELPRIWQFSYRTALPPRAPSDPA